jgi:predicted amidohydrolase YtcJ
LCFRARDLVKWDTDLYSAAVDALKDMRTEMTMLNGKVVYERRAHSHRQV